MRYSIIFLLIGVIVVGVIGFFSIPVSEQDAFVDINDVKVRVEVADSPEERARGLMFRDSLPENTGMLFIFEADGNYPFWMLNMKFSLDMIWLDSEGNVVYIAENVQPCTVTCQAIDPKVNARYVLEVNAGFIDKHKIEEGSSAHIFLPRP